MNVERIAEMEELLDRCTEATKSLEKELDRTGALLDGMSELFAYYGSDAWYEDREGELPAGLRAGVLSEDAVYDEILAVRDGAIRMLELATEILKNRL